MPQLYFAAACGRGASQPAGALAGHRQLKFPGNPPNFPRLD